MDQSFLSSGFAGVHCQPAEARHVRPSVHAQVVSRQVEDADVCVDHMVQPATARETLFVKLRATDNGVERHAANASGTTLQLDEMKELAPPARGQVILMLPNNESKARQDGEQGLQDAVAVVDLLRHLLGGDNPRVDRAMPRRNLRHGASCRVASHIGRQCGGILARRWSRVCRGGHDGKLGVGRTALRATPDRRRLCRPPRAAGGEAPGSRGVAPGRTAGARAPSPVQRASWRWRWSLGRLPKKLEHCRASGRAAATAVTTRISGGRSGRLREHSWGDDDVDTRERPRGSVGADQG